ncbi:MAG TPA: peptide MFS transporter [Sphingomicrobium sp.]|jgi:POT family proton-dependent oligopeptide transporter|nr:peptide MFS transporter [Sphingomicrobium sp.]
MGGHPRGLLVLASTELAERFSYYGMTSLLALYMVKQLLLPDHAADVIGLGALRALMEWRGPMSDQAFASLIYGWYGGLVYFTPILGGMLADRVLGAKRTVALGALLMAGGHLAMSFDASFLGALLLLILGSGLLKGNISAQVGALYAPDEESQRTRGFTIFSTGINLGAVLGPLATGGVAALYGWHAGFALAAGVMFVALAIYLLGQRFLPNPRPLSGEREQLPPLTQDEKLRSWALVGLILLTVIPNIAYTMIWSIGILWVDERVALATPLGSVPPNWFTSIDAFASIAVVPLLLGLWAAQARRGREPGSLAKFGIGAAITGVSALMFVAGELAAGADGKVAAWWAIAGFFGMGAAFMWYWPTLLSVISQSAPAKLNATLVSASYLSFFAGITIMGWVGSFYSDMGRAAFWMMDAAIGFSGALIVWIIKRPLSKRLGAC